MSSWLSLSGAPNELIMVKDAPHFGAMFDADEIRSRVMTFPGEHLN
jgi:hypothetical protein